MAPPTQQTHGTELVSEGDTGREDSAPERGQVEKTKKWENPTLSRNMVGTGREDKEAERCPPSFSLAFAGRSSGCPADAQNVRGLDAPTPLSRVPSS